MSRTEGGEGEWRVRGVRSVGSLPLALVDGCGRTTAEERSGEGSATLRSSSAQRAVEAAELTSAAVLLRAADAPGWGRSRRWRKATHQHHRRHAHRAHPLPLPSLVDPGLGLPCHGQIHWWRHRGQPQTAASAVQPVRLCPSLALGYGETLLTNEPRLESGSPLHRFPARRHIAAHAAAASTLLQLIIITFSRADGCGRVAVCGRWLRAVEPGVGQSSGWPPRLLTGGGGELLATAAGSRIHLPCCPCPADDSYALRSALHPSLPAAIGVESLRRCGGPLPLLMLGHGTQSLSLCGCAPPVASSSAGVERSAVMGARREHSTASLCPSQQQHRPRQSSTSSSLLPRCGSVRSVDRRPAGDECWVRGGEEEADERATQQHRVTRRPAAQRTRTPPAVHAGGGYTPRRAASRARQRWESVASVGLCMSNVARAEERIW